MSATALLLLLLGQTGEPRLVDGELHYQPRGTEIERVISSVTETGWVGYETEGATHSSSSCDGVVALERRGASEQRQHRGAGSTSRFILYRIHQGQVDTVRALGTGCALSTSGVPVFWLEGIEPEASLSFLTGLIQTAEERKLLGRALHAVAEHGGPDALRQLIALAKDHRAKVRGEALFWLAQRAGREAAGAIAHAVTHDPEVDIKKRAVFALAQLPPEEGVPLLIDVAETHPSLEVRERAFFWLGQSGRPEALELFEKVLLGAR